MPRRALVDSSVCGYPERIARATFDPFELALDDDAYLS
jgi:hypothetical protein